MKHFGVEVKDNDKLTRETYEEYYPLCNKGFSFEDVMYNYDKNIEFFNKLSKEEFESELSRFLQKYKYFKEIHDLSECELIGFYLIVLDEYKQVYIGVADNVKKRILQHWKKKPTCLIYANKNRSKLCIDSFKALDTTRIFLFNGESYKIISELADGLNKSIDPNYVSRTKHISETMEEDEAKMIKNFDNRFTCNRYTRYNLKSYNRDFE